MPELRPQDRAAIASEYGLPADRWQPFSHGLSNTLYLVPADPPVVLRVSSDRTAAEAEAEGWFATTLRENGFSAVLEYHRTMHGTWACAVEGGSVVAYSYRSGEVIQPLPDGRFDTLLSMLPTYFAVKASITNRPLFLRSFPSPSGALEEFRRLSRIVEISGRLRSFANGVGLSWTSNSIIHGDLHAGNLLWEDDSLLSILDFERCAKGDELTEVAALITGTCFVHQDLRLDRLLRIVAVAKQYLRHVSASRFSNSLIVMALYFFGRVNRMYPHRPTIEWRDANRALTLLQNIQEVELAFVRATER